MVWLAGVPMLFLGVAGNAQVGADAVEQQQAKKYAEVTAVGVAHDKKGPAVEIISTRPIIPEIQLLEEPPRLVIDLPRARLAVRQKRLSVQAFEISTIRIDQFQNRPPVTRVVVDLRSPRSYSWKAIGNRLLVRLKPVRAKSPSSPFQPSSVMGFSNGSTSAFVPADPGTGGFLVPVSRFAAGSSVAAGAETSVLRLGRGGEIRICPGTTLAVASSPNGRDLMVGMSTGALETHYPLGNSADSIITPDFRILLQGPGEFHYAVSADVRGNTCVRALPGNTASAIITELIGDRTLEVRSTDELMLHAGQLEQVDYASPLECGCPPSLPPVMRAATNPVEIIVEDRVPLTTSPAPKAALERSSAHPSDPALANSSAPSAPLDVSVIGKETAPLPPSKPEEVHILAVAPLVFRANEHEPAPVRQVKSLPMISAERRLELQPAMQTSPAMADASDLQDPPQPVHRGFFRKVKGFFATVFR